MGPAKWPISGLLSAEYPMISVDLRVPAPPHVRATAGPRRATHPHRVFMQQRHGERPPMARVQAEAAYARSDLLGRQRLMDDGCRNNNNVTIY